jgi:hypothetical protein
MRLLLIWLQALWLAGVAAAAASPLLLPPEPRDGLLADAREFARLGAPAAISVGPHGYSRHLRAVQRHLLAVDRRHPPIYYFFCSFYYVGKARPRSRLSGVMSNPRSAVNPL